MTTIDETAPDLTSTAHVVQCATAGIFAEGVYGGTPWRLPVLAFDQWGRPMVPNTLNAAGKLSLAEWFDPEYQLTLPGPTVRKVVRNAENRITEIVEE